ncbi:hypothetical protein GGF46_000696 [Coemansia sp. RSA 552]|nr:hypothetical protein GGF46_000696 [Coemansia sp. RSA 552]
MDAGDTRPPANGQQQPLPPAAAHGQRGLSAAPATPVHRYSAPNQLPPIQSPMSPKTDSGAAAGGSGVRPYMSPLGHTSSSPATARPAAGYTQAPYSAGQAMSAAPATATSPASLPPITGAYPRTTSYASAPQTAIPQIKSSQSLPHPASSPPPSTQSRSGPSTTASREETAASASMAAPYTSSSPSSTQVQALHTVASPVARVEQPHAQVPPMQSPHQNTASAPPPPKQAQAISPRALRTGSAQSTPILAVTHQSPQVAASGSHAASAGAAAGATFTATTPKMSAPATSLASAAVPPLGPAHSMGTVGRLSSATANGPAQPASGTQASNGPATGSSAQPQAGAAVSGGNVQAESKPPQTDAGGRPLNVSDALSYLDLVKSQFQDRPEVYNQFLEIMKEFKSHAIDTPGVIERVSRLFHGSPSLIQGFNTFLPPGYRIECSDDPAEGVRVTTPSGSIIPDMQRRTATAAGTSGQTQPLSPQSGPQAQTPGQRNLQYAQQQQQQYASRDQYGARRPAPPGGSGAPGNQPIQATSSAQALAHTAGSQGAGYHAPGQPAAGAAAAPQSPSAMRSPSMGASQRPRQVPVEFNHAITYVNKIKMRFAAEPDRYKEFLEILQTYQKESRPIQEVYAQVQHLFSSAPDLLDEFKQFLPDTSESGAAAMASLGSPSAAYAHAGGGMAQGQAGQANAQHGISDGMAGNRLPPVGNFAPAGSGHAADLFAAGGAAGAQAAGMAYDKGPGGTPASGRKRRGVMDPSAQGAGAGSSKRRSKGPKGSSLMADMGAGYGQSAATAMQQAANPATATPDELTFFESVKRFIGQPNAYNEFLKLLNLYNQQILDPKTLVERAESFIGDDRELYGWFKRFVGFNERQLDLEDSRSGDEAVMESVLGPNPGPYMPPEEVAKTLRPPRPKVNLSQCKSYGQSYRLLPEASTKAKCSGRDAMCYEVLNDRWASHPTWASEDTEFVHHKKNQFEEAMFRSEEDRHEMDIEIDTNLSVIRQLTPIAQQIEQMDPDKQMQLTLPENFFGMSEALPRRALRKVYDSSRALEIIKAMHTHPAVAIPIVLRRLKQKDEEWRRQRREYAKVWREIDAKNYYRALDHQGLTFKSTDRKNTAPKQLITEIETRRREQQNLLADEASGVRRQNPKVTSALRHRYQLEFQFADTSVVSDVINAILGHVGRPGTQFAASEKEMMEQFFQDLFGGLMGIDGPEQLYSSGSTSDNEDNSDAEKSKSPAPATNGHAANGTADDTKGSADEAAESPADVMADSQDASKAATPAATEPPVSGDAAMDVDAKSEATSKDEGAAAKEPPAKEANGLPNGVAGKPPLSAGSSKPSTPGLISSRSWIQIGSGARAPSAAPSQGSGAKNVSRAFYTNSSYYTFLRLFQILYERFNRFRELGPECQSRARQGQSAATKLGLRPQLDVLKAYDMERTDYYTIFLELVDQTLQGQLDTPAFEEAMRMMYGINAYRILTVDRVVQAVCKGIQHLINDARCVDILELFTSLPAVHEQSPLRSHIAYRMKVEALVGGAEEHVFRVDYLYDSQTMTIQLLRREDITLDEAVTEEELWAYYVDSYVLFEPTEGVPQLEGQDRPRPYLRRHLHADECDYQISSRSNLEIKIAVNTYKLCFLTGTEDIYANHSRRARLAADGTARTACDRLWAERTQKWHEWLAQEHEERQQTQTGDDGDEQQQAPLAEWWKP